MERTLSDILREREEELDTLNGNPEPLSNARLTHLMVKMNQNYEFLRAFVDGVSDHMYLMESKIGKMEAEIKTLRKQLDYYKGIGR